MPRSTPGRRAPAPADQPVELRLEARPHTHEDDAKQSAIVMEALAWHPGKRDERIARSTKSQ